MVINIVQLVEKDCNMENYLLIKADYNDGDYDLCMTSITDNEIELIRPIVAAIKANNGHYYNREFADSSCSAKISYGHFEGFEFFDECTPLGESECPGIHTIKSVQIITILEQLL